MKEFWSIDKDGFKKKVYFFVKDVKVIEQVDNETCIAGVLVCNIVYHYRLIMPAEKLNKLVKLNQFHLLTEN